MISYCECGHTRISANGCSSNKYKCSIEKNINDLGGKLVILMRQRIECLIMLQNTTNQSSPFPHKKSMYFIQKSLFSCIVCRIAFCMKRSLFANEIKNAVAWYHLAFVFACTAIWYGEHVVNLQEIPTKEYILFKRCHGYRLAGILPHMMSFCLHQYVVEFCLIFRLLHVCTVVFKESQTVSHAASINTLNCWHVYLDFLLR